jgi:hypothetical protein
MRGAAELLSPHGYLLVVCRAAEGPVPLDSGPPWALTERDLKAAAAAADLRAESIAVFLDNETPPVRRMRGLFRRRA